MLQFNKQVVLAVGLVVDGRLLPLIAGAVKGVPGTRHPVWQFAAAALHVIMQVVAADDCASRIFPAANAPAGAAISIAAAHSKITKLRMTAPWLRRP